MAPAESQIACVESYINLLADKDIGDFQKVLEMKGFKRSEQMDMIELFKKTANISDSENVASVADQDSSRIRKLEKLIKKQF